MFTSKRGKNQSGTEQLLCRYQLQHDSNRITIVADCKECQGNADLNDRKCLTGILNGLCQEYNVDEVILSHYIETKYTGDSMQMLRMMVEIVHALEQMSIREPFDEYFADDSRLSSSFKSQQKSVCEKCELRPERAFSALKKLLLMDISRFYTAFDSLSHKVEGNREKACAECMKATKSDLIYLFNKLEEFRAFVIYKGFQIVI